MDLQTTDVQIREVTRSEIPVIKDLNWSIFQDERVIHTFDRPDLMLLLAELDGRPVGFKVGYSTNDETFYSAKGGVLSEYRHEGIARDLLYAMIERARAKGFSRFIYDTFPNKHPGMTIIGLKEGFQVIKAGYNTLFEDYRLRFEKDL